MMLRFASFLFLAAAVVATPNPSPWKAAELTTNRERLARNLPPLPPKFGRSLPGNARAVDSPSRMHAARASPSPSPPSSKPPVVIIYTGRIEVRNATNYTLGFLQNTPGGFNVPNPYTDSTYRYLEKRGSGGYNSDSDLHVTFSTTGSGKGPFDIIANNPKFSGPVNLGGETGNSSPYLSDNSAATINFKNVDPTPPRSRPVKGPTGYEESSIWSIDPGTNEITAHWINPDGSPASTIIAYDIQENFFFFTGNVDLFNDAKHADAIPVEFFFLSDD